MENEQGKSYVEILTVLNCMETEYQEKIPKKLIEFFKRNSAKDYKFDLDAKVPLKEQNLKDKTLSLLAMIDLNYWCKSAEEKQKLIRHYLENEKQYHDELKEKYNSDNLFQNKQEEIVVENTNLPVQVKEESFFKKIINFIKGLFK